MALSRRRKLAFGLVTAAAAMVALEVALRFLTREIGRITIPDQQVRSHVEQGSMKYHPELGWVRAQLPMPGLGINAEGFRYEDVPREKPAGTWRGFTFGDSQTYGAGVDVDETYTWFAEEALRERDTSGQTLQLINTGISGYGSLQVLRLIRSKILEWDPDLLVVDCRTFDSPPDDVIAPMKMQSEGLRRLLWESRTYYMLRFVMYRFGPNAPRPMTAGSVDQAPPPVAHDPMHRAGNHQAIADLAADEGVDLIFLNYPFWDFRESDGKNEIICLAPDDELPKGVPIGRVCEALQESGRAGADLFLDNNHLAVSGNQIVGRALADALIAEGLVPR